MGEIRVVLAEDSPTIRHFLVDIIEQTPDMSVIGIARNGVEVIQMVDDLRPDVVSMDINMPELDGLEATRHIMLTTPTPIVVVSGLLVGDVRLSLQAIEAGALAVVDKPPDRKHPTFDDKHRQLINTLRAMAGVKVISRRLPQTLDITNGHLQRKNTGRLSTNIPRPELIAIGASTGGPSALLQLLQYIQRKSSSIPIVIAQHMPAEFINGLAQWLNAVTSPSVIVATDDMLIEKGMIILAPGDANLKIVRRDGHLWAKLTDESSKLLYSPSVDVLFESVAKHVGERAVGVILTGMGDDGAKGLLAIRKAGGYTLAQDEETSTVFGMPRAAIELGAVRRVSPLIDLGTKINKML